ncbi:MAG: SCO family protein [Terracidiphilus sp.]
MMLSHSRCWMAMLALLLVPAAGCRHGSAGAAPAAQSNLRRYHLRGLILGKSNITGQVMVQQEAIPGFLPAINEAYRVPDSTAFARLSPGDEITAEVLVPAGNDDFSLTNITVTAEPRKDLLPSMLPPHRLLVGEPVPDIPLVNQDGRTIRLQQNRGKAVLITFIDTECTDDCPVLTALFARVNALLERDPKAYAQSRLISVSIDPAHDTPPVLRRYGLKFLHNDPAAFSHWEFADTSAAQLKRLATAFGVAYLPTGGDILHTMQTTLIGPQNTVLRSWEGDDWNPAVVAAAVRAATQQTGASTQATHTAHHSPGNRASVSPAVS